MIEELRERVQIYLLLVLLTIVFVVCAIAQRERCALPASAVRLFSTCTRDEIHNNRRKVLTTEFNYGFKTLDIDVKLLRFCVPASSFSTCTTFGDSRSIVSLIFSRKTTEFTLRAFGCTTKPLATASRQAQTTAVKECMIGFFGCC
jgi:hypothetical protein